LLCGCASIERTRDKSDTLVRAVRSDQLDSVAILPIKEYAVAEGLSTQIEAALQQGISKNLPSTKTVDPTTFSSLLGRAGLMQSYAQWLSTYEATSYIEPQPLVSFANATSARYFLLVPSLYLNREKTTGAATGYTGMVSDANNVWRTDLTASAVLIDTHTATVVWRGTGYAENISSKKKDVDLGLVIINRRSPEITDRLGELIQTMADGIGKQIAGVGVAVYAQRNTVGVGANGTDGASLRTSYEAKSVVQATTPSVGSYEVVVARDLRAWFGPGGQGGLLVTDVDKNGPAARAGIKVGDVVTAVDGQATAPYRWESATSLITNGEGNTVRLVVLSKK